LVFDNWLRHVQDVVHEHQELLAKIDDEEQRFDRLCELNVIEQARHVAHTTVVQDAWARGHTVAIHGWIYALQDGLLRDVGFFADCPDVVDSSYHDALSAIAARKIRC